MELDLTLGFRFVWATYDDKLHHKAMLLKEVIDREKKGFVPVGNEIVRKKPIVSKWYELIAAANGLDPFDPLVAEAYWIGNELLEREFDFSGIHNYIMETFNGAERGYKMPPQGSFPHHNLHVTNYRLVSKPEASLDEIDACMVTPAIMESNGIEATHVLTGDRITGFKNPFEFDISVRMHVALHRNIVCATLDECRQERLLKYGYNR
ncbi:MAG: hypothetical protein KKG59_05460 [Nanoarchaeota archaeon]|nr:hypothetical protein [Nanoarchaeota archaeon]